MDNFKAIYKVLQALERSMDLPAFDISELALDAMGVSTERQYRYLEMLQDAGLIKNAELYTNREGGLCLKNPRGIRITLRGLEYLQENAFMKRRYKAAKGITDLIS
nr:MAG TPA: YjcQ protein [Caudoviricetes sp.]